MRAVLSVSGPDGFTVRATTECKVNDRIETRVPKTNSVLEHSNQPAGIRRG